MISIEDLLRRETRKPLVLKLLRHLLKESRVQKDEVIKSYLTRTSLYCFKKERKNSDVKEISDFLNLQADLLNSIKKANLGNYESTKYLVNLSYGQVCFTPRHDHFIQAKYLAKLPFGKKSTMTMPLNEDYQILGPNPIPLEYVDYILRYTEKNPEHKKAYADILKLRFSK